MVLDNEIYIAAWLFFRRKWSRTAYEAWDWQVTHESKIK